MLESRVLEKSGVVRGLKRARQTSLTGLVLSSNVFVHVPQGIIQISLYFPPNWVPQVVLPMECLSSYSLP